MNEKDVLIDTDALVALIIRVDNNHRAAKKISKIIEEKNYNLFLTNLVIQELVTVISHRVGQEQAIKAYQKVKARQPKIIFVDATLEEKAYKIFLAQSKKGTSFVDCANMAVMNHLNLETIFSFDKIYKQNRLRRLGID